MPSEQGAVPPGQGVTRGWPVLHMGSVPKPDLDTWTLRVGGAVERPFELDWEGLSALPRGVATADMHCVTRWSRLENRWEGVLLSEVAARADVSPAARFVRFADGRSYDTSVPLGIALAPETILATHHNRRPLAPEHGGPLRAVVPRLYAWKSCKWLREIEFLERDVLGFWEQRGYHPDGDPWREERLV